MIALSIIRFVHCAFIARPSTFFFLFFFFNDTATTEIYTLSLHDALPISRIGPAGVGPRPWRSAEKTVELDYLEEVKVVTRFPRSEEHTSELQSHSDLVCRLLLEKKKKKKKIINKIKEKTIRSSDKHERLR